MDVNYGKQQVYNSIRGLETNHGKCSPFVTQKQNN